MTNNEQIDDLEWEEWDGSTPFHIHMAAGSIAGLAEHTLLFPLDTIKTHIQCLGCSKATECVKTSTTTKPFGSYGKIVSLLKAQNQFYRGVQTMVVGCAPAHALYFSSFEVVKQSFAEENLAVGAALAGGVATFFHDCVMTPMDTLKQRLQLGLHSNMSSALKYIMSDSAGLGVLYRSFPITLLTNLPYGGVMVSVNEQLKHHLHLNNKNMTDIQINLLSGSIAGAIASFVTTPLDVVKTKLQTNVNFTRVTEFPHLHNTQQQSKIKTATGIPPFASSTAAAQHQLGAAFVHTNAENQCEYIEQLRRSSINPPKKNLTASSVFRAIFKEEGLQGFFRGSVPRVVSHAPAVAISWTTYEYAKKVLLDAYEQ